MADKQRWELAAEMVRTLDVQELKRKLAEEWVAALFWRERAEKLEAELRVKTEEFRARVEELESAISGSDAWPSLEDRTGDGDHLE